MRHLLLTRYNVLTRFTDRSGFDPLDPEYLRHRGGLFRRYCVPSVLRQTCKDFTWIVFFDPATPAEHYAPLAGYADVKLCKTMAEGLDAVKAMLPEGPVITSRVDNDDALAPDFIERVQAAARAERRPGSFVISFERGLEVLLRSRRHRRRVWIQNQFPSLVVDGALRKTILDFSHTRLDRMFPVVAVDTAEPMWLTIIHERNVANRRRWKLELRPSNGRLKHRFPGFDEGPLYYAPLIGKALCPQSVV